MSAQPAFPDTDQLAAQWPVVLEQLGDQFGTERLVRMAKIWLSPSKVRPILVQQSAESSTAATLVLECPNTMFQRFIKQHFKTLIPAVASDVFGIHISDVVAKVTREGLREHRARIDEVSQTVAAEAQRRVAGTALEPKADGGGQGVLGGSSASLGNVEKGVKSGIGSDLGINSTSLNDSALHGNSAKNTPLETSAFYLKPSTHEQTASVRRARRSNRSYKVLDDFVVGRCNQLAYHAITNILEDPAGPANPLFIHGASGLGKTHLEQGLARAFKSRYPKSTVLYTTCEQFKNDFMAANAKGQDHLQALRVRLRHADLLLVDDIHFLSRGTAEKTKQELFLTLDELDQHGKKVVITSDAHPSDISYLEQRFVQRFTGGLVIRLEQPDLDTRRDVVIAKGRHQGAMLPDEVASFIADHITDNIREIEGAVHKVITYAKSFRRAIDLELSRQALSDVLARDASEPRQKVVLRAIADYFDITVEDILSRRRTGNLPSARHIAMWVLKYSGNDTYAAVAQMFGLKSHAAVMHACEQVIKRRDEDPEIDRFVSDLLLRVQRR